MRTVGLVIIVFLWVVWIFIYSQMVRIGMAFGESFWRALWPGLPVTGMSIGDWTAYVTVVALLYGGPIILALVSRRAVGRLRAGCDCSGHPSGQARRP